MHLEFNNYVTNYLDNCRPEKAKKKILRWLERLETEGHAKLMLTKDVKKLETKENLYELRIIFSNILYRLLFIIQPPSYLFIHSFHKKVGEKTPPKEIQTALSRIKLLIK